MAPSANILAAGPHVDPATPRPIGRGSTARPSRIGARRRRSVVPLRARLVAWIVARAELGIGPLAASCLACVGPADADPHETEGSTGLDASTGATAMSDELDGDGSPTSGASPADDVATECGEAQARTLAQLETACGACHLGEAAVAGFDAVTDVERLVAEGYLVPGDASASPLFQRVVEGQMPPPGFEPVSDVARGTMEWWIDGCLGASIGCEAERPWITVVDTLEAIAADLRALPEAQARFQRYLTATHIYNLGRCPDVLRQYEAAVSKTVNSLSTGDQISAARAIDEHHTIVRIDLRHYGWDPSVWEAIVAADPMAVQPSLGPGAFVQQATQTAVPIVAADWFVANTLQPPLYHQLLPLPPTLAELELALGVDLAQDVERAAVQRAGFVASGVSVNNRLIERHALAGGPERVLWRSYDFDGNVGLDNIFAHPLDFVAAGGELIYSLPNGLHGYGLYDAAGNRLDRAPAEIVTDPAMPDGRVVNGLSCMRCHAAGIIPRTDHLRAFVLEGDFAPVVRARVAALHPPAGQGTAQQADDVAAYRARLIEAGVPPVGAEPTAVVWQDYRADVDLLRAAAELGIDPQYLLAVLEDLPVEVQTLGGRGVVKRALWEQRHGEIVCRLGLGVTAACEP